MTARSIRGRLALWLAFVVFASFASFSVILYSYFSKILDEDLDVFVDSRAEGVVHSIRAYASASALRPGVFAPPPGPAALRQLALLWTGQSAGSSLLLSTGVQIFGPDGALLAATHGLDAAVGLPPEALARAKAGEASRRSVRIGVEIGGSRVFRILALPVDLGSGFAFVVQIIVSRVRVESALTALRLLLIFLSPLSALAAGLAAALVVRRLTRPLSVMAATLGRITERRLDERVSADPASSSELVELAAAFNAMMDGMERAFAEQARFTSDAAHQLKTPLTVLRGELELALKRERTAEEYVRVLESNLEEVERMNLLVGRMLDLARLDAGRVDFSDEPVRLDLLIRDIAIDLEPIAVSAGIGLEIRAPEPASVPGDPLRLKQAFVNLIENALHYGVAGTAVEISVVAEEDSARIEIRDHGRGLPPAELDSVFLRFHRGSNALGSGYGIGLSLARSAIELHGGRLTAANHPGGGALFIAVLPSSRAD